VSNNFSSSVAGLSLLSGSNIFSLFADSAPVETRAVRVAKAQFNAKPAATLPWSRSVKAPPVSQQVAAIKTMKTIIDAAGPIATPADRDIQTSFVTFKALDRLRVLAEASAAATTGSGERLQLDRAFSRGLSDLQTFLSQAPTDKVALAFGVSTRRDDSVVIATPKTLTVKGSAVAAARTDAIPGLTGNEIFRVDLSRPGRTDSIMVDLSQSAQPPTLTSVAEAINAAIVAVPQLDANGVPVVDANGVVVPRWTARFEPTKTGDKWGLTMNTVNDLERVRLVDTAASDAVFVAGGMDGLNAATTTQLYRFDDAEGALQQKTLGQITAIDREASARAALLQPTGSAKTPRASTQVAAATTAQAVVSDGQGNNYVVGTSSGDIGSNLASGDDLFLTKLDNMGSVVWQRSLGANGSASGAAISLTPDGDIVVAGTVTGNFDGAASDGDMVVSRFSAQGDEKFSTLVRSLGSDTATAVAVGADGAIFVGGRSATGGGDAFVARLDATGRLAERRTIDTGGNDGVKALAIGDDGNVLALVQSGAAATVRRLSAASLVTEIGSLSLGNVDARAMAVAADGSIAVGGASTVAGNRDGFVARIDAGLAGVQSTAIASTASDEIDSITWSGGTIIAGGRTTGTLDGARRGMVDGFVARIDGSSGTVETVRQFGVAERTAAPVRVAVAAGGTNKLGALGLSDGVLNPGGSNSLVAQTSLRAGDEFSLKVGAGPMTRIVIRADDTVKTLVARIALQTRSRTAVTDGFSTAGSVLRFQASVAVPIVLVAGREGQDALAKLGLEPQRLTAPPLPKDSAPKVSPGGTFSLDLKEAFNVATAKDAAVAVKAIKSAIITTQGAYRSLYWDSGKALLVNGFGGGAGPTAAQSKQLAGYREALARLTPSSGFPTFTGF